MGESPDGPIGPVEDGRREFMFAVVCDGMGGMRDGAIASHIVIEGLLEWARAQPMDDVDTTLESLSESLEAVEGIIMESHPGSGTTLSVVFDVSNEWVSIHLGDSRCYVTGPGLWWRTADHSPVEAMFRNGLIDEDEMNEHPMSNLISKYVGGDHSNKTDVESVPPGWDKLILCSDGAFGYMSPSQFQNLMEAAGSAKEIVKTSLEQGSKDNTSVLMISVNEL